ncbi:glycosyltransferase [Rhodobacteraceae bacterium CH30]|nr:glycosyltransferase [Rhodobacteraceae bacterium CH30]
MQKSKPKVLLMIKHYLPGHKSGGPVRTISNMVDTLGDSIDFNIITSDRDLGDSHPYENIKTDIWIRTGNANVKYLSNTPSIISLIKIIKETPHEIIYLNSFFDYQFSIKVMIAHALSNSSSKILLAPRGEFSQGALAIKSLKKKIFITLFNKAYKSIDWHASSPMESEDIQKVIDPELNKIHIALDLPENSIKKFEPRAALTGSSLKVAFISRISPMKNLHFAIKTVCQAKGHIDFDIYGPKEDYLYWKKCELQIGKAPSNINIDFKGAIDNKDVVNTFSKYDIFFFPTLGENYGHVICEALTAGTPVLISDQTPWVELEKNGLGWEAPLDDISYFTKKLDLLCENLEEQRRESRKDRHSRLISYICLEKTIGDNIKIFNI